MSNGTQAPTTPPPTKEALAFIESERKSLQQTRYHTPFVKTCRKEFSKQFDDHDDSSEEENHPNKRKVRSTFCTNLKFEDNVDSEVTDRKKENDQNGHNKENLNSKKSTTRNPKKRNEETKEKNQLPVFTFNKKECREKGSNATDDNDDDDNYCDDEIMINKKKLPSKDAHPPRDDRKLEFKSANNLIFKTPPNNMLDKKKQDEIMEKVKAIEGSESLSCISSILENILSVKDPNQQSEVLKKLKQMSLLHTFMLQGETGEVTMRGTSENENDEVDTSRLLDVHRHAEECVNSSKELLEALKAAATPMPKHSQKRIFKNEQSQLLSPKAISKNLFQA